MKLDNTEWLLSSCFSSSFINLWLVWVWSAWGIYFILLISIILQLNMSFVLKTQTEFQLKTNQSNLTYPIQLKTNQKCRLPFSCTASAFLEFSLWKAEFIFHIRSYISLFLHLPLRKKVLSTVIDTWCAETGKIFLRAILTPNQYLQLLSACSHSTTRSMP